MNTVYLRNYGCQVKIVSNHRLWYIRQRYVRTILWYHLRSVFFSIFVRFHKCNETLIKSNRLLAGTRTHSRMSCAHEPEFFGCPNGKKRGEKNWNFRSNQEAGSSWINICVAMARYRYIINRLQSRLKNSDDEHFNRYKSPINECQTKILMRFFRLPTNRSRSSRSRSWLFLAVRVCMWVISSFCITLLNDVKRECEMRKII